VGIGRVLLVDDDRALRDSVGRALRLEGYDVVLATDGPEALGAMAGAGADLVVLDVSMPTMSGFEVCRRLRAGGERTAVLMLTARDGVPERVAGLDAGADDYLVKPFALDELLARVRANIRRVIDGRAAVEEDPAALAEPGESLVFADLRMDRAARMAFRGERRLELTKTEHTLLEYFMTNPGTVLARGVIFDHVWGYDLTASSKVLDVYVCYLRRKTEAEGEARLLHTVRSVGYVLREPY
jgi:two-component system response regulator MprA